MGIQTQRRRRKTKQRKRKRKRKRRRTVKTKSGFKKDHCAPRLSHEKLEFRNFVLVPLNEILPNWIHPKTKEHIGSLLKKLNDVDKTSILKIKKY